MNISTQSHLGDQNTFEKNSNLVDYAVEFSKLHGNNIAFDERKNIGQIFTPKETSEFMAEFIDISKPNISLLDPGAGTGNLLSAVCQRIFDTSSHATNIRIDAFENDPSVLPYLERVLSFCKEILSSKGHTLEFNIITDDFILINENYLNINSKSERENLFYYDAVISNPPYYKINKNSIHANVMKDFISGQPNIYSCFMTLSAHMIKEGGEFVFITPRSFCSGLYYKKIRKWFVQNSCIKSLHCFESRNNQFVTDKILQENVILHAVKTCTGECPPVHISTSDNHTFSDYHEIEVRYDDLIFLKDTESCIRIPTSETELRIIETVDSWENTLTDFGLKMSTGPVVDFRTKENLRFECNEGKTAPLIWMQNLKGNSIKWPLRGLKKPQNIEINASTKRLLLSTKNYVLIKRFTSKEQKRRIFATPFLKNEFESHEFIGFENHLNYIHRPKGELTSDEVYGLSVLFNTKLIDLFFRTINGNTQVNASEINLLPIPDIDIIRKIGQEYQRLEKRVSLNLDKFVGQYLEIDSDLVDLIK